MNSWDGVGYWFYPIAIDYLNYKSYSSVLWDNGTFPGALVCPASSKAGDHADRPYTWNGQQWDAEHNSTYWTCYLTVYEVLGIKHGAYGSQPYWDAQRALAGCSSQDVLFLEQFDGHSEYYDDGQNHWEGRGGLEAGQALNLANSGRISFRHKQQQSMSVTSIDGHVAPIRRTSFQQQASANPNGWFRTLQP